MKYKIHVRIRGTAVMRKSMPLRNMLRHQATQARRTFVLNGILISARELCARLRINERRLEKLVREGSVCSLIVDGSAYYPAFFVDPHLNQRRLQRICRMLFPAPSDARFDFLASRHGSLGDRRPLELLDDDCDYTRLRANAAAWVAQWSQTTVKLYDGEHDVEPQNVTPLYTAAAEINPRRSILDRASTTLAAYEYEFPHEPYPEARIFTAFVKHQNVGDAEPRQDACMRIVVDGDVIRICVVYNEGLSRESHAVAIGKHRSVVDVARKAFYYLRRRRP
ncbi:hypothetical protein [Paraburkholderia sp. DGU8]|uniref:hypothetical protein n=1 Tax=Paraburkholderia sp. DGU8 TaxID=3161997 RepID=UPI0034662217